MEVVQAFLAQSATSDPSGTFDAKGIFWQFNAERYPASIPPFTFVLVFSVEKPFGDAPVRLELSVRNRETGETLQRWPIGVNLVYPDAQKAEAQGEADFQIVLNFDGLNLDEPGEYEFRYKINEERPQALRLRARLKTRSPER